MTNDEIDKEIAEFCGWKLEPLDGREFNGIPVMVWVDPDGERGFPIPCYSLDLNAMHEVEKAAFKGSALWVEFTVNLLNVLQASEMSVSDGMACVLQATALQRAEAFVRTIGKWRGE